MTTPAPTPAPATPTKWLTADEQAAWRAWLFASLRLLDVIDAEIPDPCKDFLEYHILVQALEAGDAGARVNDLAAGVVASPQHCSQRVTQMAKRGLIATRPDRDDARARRVTITPTGKDYLRKAAPGHVASVRARIFDQLTPEQVAQLHTINQALLAGLDT